MKRLTAMTLVPVFASALCLCACGNGSGETDDGQPADVSTGEDTATPADTAGNDDSTRPDTNLLDTVAPDAAEDTAVGDMATDDTVTDGLTDDLPADDTPGDTATDTGDAGPLDPTWTMEACPTGAGVNRVMPWVTEFDIGGDMTPNGWELIMPQFAAGAMWDLAISDRDFGTFGGRYAVFMGGEAPVARTGIYSDCVDTSFCAASGSLTLQWRMQYLHADPEKSVTLKLVAITGTDLDAGEVLWTRTVSEDIPYGLFSVNVTGAAATTNGIRFALVLELPAESALITEKWSIDHFVMACGKPNVNVKTLMYACPAGDTECNLSTATQIGDAVPAGTQPSITIDYCDKALLVLCGYDEDATASTWQTFGFPAIMRDTPPTLPGGTMTPALAVGAHNGCETLPQQVALVCGTPAVATPGYFYCATEFSVDCDFGFVATWETAPIIRDELDPSGVAPLHSPLESRLPLTVTATYTPE